MHQAEAQLGSIQVHTVSNRGWNPEELAGRAVDRIVSVGDSSHPVIRDQARAFKENIRQVVEFYLREAQRSERTTICALLDQQGRTDMANIVRSL